MVLNNRVWAVLFIETFLSVLSHMEFYTFRQIPRVPPLIISLGTNNALPFLNILK